MILCPGNGDFIGPIDNRPLKTAREHAVELASEKKVQAPVTQQAPVHKAHNHNETDDHAISAFHLTNESYIKITMPMCIPLILLRNLDLTHDLFQGAHLDNIQPGALSHLVPCDGGQLYGPIVFRSRESGGTLFSGESEFLSSWFGVVRVTVGGRINVQMLNSVVWNEGNHANDFVLQRTAQQKE